MEPQLFKIDMWEFLKGVFGILKVFWPLWVLLVVVVTFRIVFESWLPGAIYNWRNRRRFGAGEKWRSDREILQWLRGMKPPEFEQYIADLFNRLGYKTQTVGGPSDGGIDVIAEKNGVKHYIQCKKFITSKVTVGDVRDFYGALADHLVRDKGIFITTNIFTVDAERFTEDKPIELIDGNRLIKYIHLAKKEAVRPAANVQAVDKTCPKCGGTLIKRTGKHGEFYGCSNFPKCRHTEDLSFSSS